MDKCFRATRPFILLNWFSFTNNRNCTFVYVKYTLDWWYCSFQPELIIISFCLFYFQVNREIHQVNPSIHHYLSLFCIDFALIGQIMNTDKNRTTTIVNSPIKARKDQQGHCFHLGVSYSVGKTREVFKNKKKRISCQ
jgi:hypothetical protein